MPLKMISAVSLFFSTKLLSSCTCSPFCSPCIHQWNAAQKRQICQNLPSKFGKLKAREILLQNHSWLIVVGLPTKSPCQCKIIPYCVLTSALSRLVLNVLSDRASLGRLFQSLKDLTGRRGVSLAVQTKSPHSQSHSIIPSCMLFYPWSLQTFGSCCAVSCIPALGWKAYRKWLCTHNHT